MIEGSDADSFAYSLSNFEEIIFPCLEAVEPRSVIEVGAFRGATTRELLGWARDRYCAVTAIEPVPPDELLALEREQPQLRLIRETSHVALRELDSADVILLDGDHNYYTLSHELRLIADRSPGSRMPLLMLHDAGWPLARRDAYEAPDRIPEEHRQPIARGVGLRPGDAGVVRGGLYYDCVAEREGGPRNGVLTAIEDFVGEHPDLRAAVIPAFFGLAAVWHTHAPWADRVARLLAPWDRNPILRRLEENRVLHLIARLDLDYELHSRRATNGGRQPRLSAIRRHLSRGG